MGWTTTRCEPNQAAKFLKQEFEGDNERATWLVLDRAKVGNVHYLKMSHFHKDTKKTDIYILVVLTSWNNKDYWFNFGYKEMDESSGPYYYDCPLRLLEGLTEPLSENSTQWRQKVREHHAKRRNKPKVGQRIKFAKPITFSFGSGVSREYHTFDVVKYKKSGIAYRPVDSSCICRITNIADRDFEIVTEEQHAVVA